VFDEAVGGAADQTIVERRVPHAENIPGAHLVVLEGTDHWFWAGNQEPLLAQIRAMTR